MDHGQWSIVYGLLSKNKNSRPQMGREAPMRPVVPPTLIALNYIQDATHFTPTNIGLSCNVEMTAQTTRTRSFT